MQCSIVNYSCHAVHFISTTYLYYDWKFVPFVQLHPFHSLPPTPTSGTHQSLLCFHNFHFILWPVFSPSSFRGRHNTFLRTTVRKRSGLVDFVIQHYACIERSTHTLLGNVESLRNLILPLQSLWNLSDLPLGIRDWSISQCRLFCHISFMSVTA